MERLTIMPIFRSQVATNTDSFNQNRTGMLAQIENLRELEKRIRDRSESSRDRFTNRNQLLPRDRLNLLLDRGTPWLELSTLAGFKTYDDDGEKTISGARLITGIGKVSNVRCIVIVDDSGIMAGALHTYGVKKMIRAFDIALENKMPVVHLVQSAGADLLTYVPETFMNGGSMFFKQARLSASGCPVITVVHGASTAGGAYMPGMSDYTIMVRGQAKAFLAGAPLVRAATGEIADDETLGGTEMHATTTGLAEYVANDDSEALAICRQVVDQLNWSRYSRPPLPSKFKEPAYAIHELCGIVSMDYQKPYDVREVIARLVDGSEFLEFKTLYDAQTICCHARIHGFTCGLIGNNGPITAEGATKAAQFIQLCSQSGTPLIFLQNTTGFVVGTDPEQRGIIKHGAKLIQAVSNSQVPRITLMIGASFGAGNYAMSGWSYEPHFILGWPNYKSGVMGAKQAALVMRIVNEEAAKRKGNPLDKNALDALENEVLDLFHSTEDGYYFSARLQDDGIIDPRDSRKVLALLLEICDEANRRTLHPNTFGVSRF